MKTLLEICCPTVETASIAEQCGASRVELCSNLEVGGTTPTQQEIILVKQKLQIPIHVLIRPRAGTFDYNEIELQQMIAEISFCKSKKIDGVVIGALLENGELDEIKMKEMIASAKPMHITFHKSFDECKNPFKTLDKLIELGVNQILTSGQKPTALEGIEMLKALQLKTQNKITIMPGGSVRAENVAEIIRQTHATAIHSAAGVLKGNEYFKKEIQQMKFELI